MRHLLIVAPNWLGDTVMAQPAMRALCQNLKPAKISLNGPAWLADLLPFLELPQASYRPETPDDADMAILFPNSFRAAWKIWQAGISKRIGFSGQWRRPLLTQALKSHVNMAVEHHRLYYLDLVKQLGIPTLKTEVQLTAPETEMRLGQEAIIMHGLNPARTICVAPGAQFGGAKQYPPDSYAKVIAGLRKDGWQILLLGVQKERNIINECLNGVHAKYWNAAGETSLREALQILAACRLLLCNDSGLMHAAAGMGKPIVAIFGATDPARTAPSGKKVRLLYHPADCSPCLKRECNAVGQPCMTNTRPEAVIDACEKALV